ncbi:MAG: histidine phosphatase family protein [Chloroflexota bacterium]
MENGRVQITVKTQKRIYLMRHGHTFDVTPDAPILEAEAQLTEKGRAQAEETAVFLNKHIQFDAIYSTELQRTIDTATPIATLQNLSITQLADLNELRFDLPSGSTFKDLYKAFQALRDELKQRPLDEIVMGKRPFSEIFNGYLSGLQTVLDGPGDTILVVAHGGTNMMLICYVLGLPLHRLMRFHQNNCGINIIDCLPPGRFALRLLNYTCWDPLKGTIAM